MSTCDTANVSSAGNVIISGNHCVSLPDHICTEHFRELNSNIVREAGGERAGIGFTSLLSVCICVRACLCQLAKICIIQSFVC